MILFFFIQGSFKCFKGERNIDDTLHVIKLNVITCSKIKGYNKIKGYKIKDYNML